MRVLSGCCDKTFRIISSQERTATIIKGLGNMTINIPLDLSERYLFNNKSYLEINIPLKPQKISLLLQSCLT